MKSVPMRAINQTAEQEARYSLKSPLLFGAVQALAPEMRHEILDLAPANPDTLDFFSQYRCRLHLPGCRDQLLQQRCGDDPEAMPRALPLADYMPWPQDKYVPLDLVLLWDLPNYLDRQTLHELIAYLAPAITPNTVLHVYIHTRQVMPVRPGDYRLSDTQLVLVDAPSPWSATSPMYYQELLHKLLTPFRIDRGMLLANGLQEYILRAHASPPLK
jgi:hypothetical protein